MSSPSDNGGARLDEALKAHRRGWALTPLHGKKPILPRWQIQPPPTEGHVREWVAEGHNLGLRTGRISKLIGVDDDTEDGSGAKALGLPPTVTVVTGSGKRHYLFKASEVPIGNSASKLHDRVDIRGDGGQLVLVGSIHPDTGQPYRWLEGHSPDEIELAELPTHIVERLRVGETSTNGHVPPASPAPAPQPCHPVPQPDRYLDAAVRGAAADIASTPEGARNDTLNAKAYKLGRLGAPEGEAEDLLVEAAKAAGLPEREARKTVRSGMQAGKKKPRQRQSRDLPIETDGKLVKYERPPHAPRSATNGTVSETPPVTESAPPDMAAILARMQATRPTPPPAQLPPPPRLPPPPAPPGFPSPPNTRWLHRTDIGNAERLVAHHRNDLLYCDSRAGWQVWDGRRYKADAIGRVELLAKKVVRSILQEAAEINDPEEAERHAKFAFASEKDARIKAMLARARVEEPFACTTDELDSDDWLLNVQNGTLDLRTGELHAHRRADRITKLAQVVYDPNAQCEDWDNFLALATGRDKELQSWMQRFAGYSLTGETCEDLVPIFHGPGGTGKSTYLEVQKGMLGDYAMTISWEVLLQKQHGGGGGPRDEIARLAGARLVIASEVEADRHLNAGLFKSLAGGDTIAARFLYKGTFEFRPTFKFLLAANDLPHTRPGDSGSWRRLVVVPFKHRFPESKEGKKQRARLRLPDARSAELAWTMRGLAEWRNRGLGTCPAIERATAAYRSVEAMLDRFLAERCVLDPEASEPSAKLHAAFVEYVEAQAPGRTPMNVTRFGLELKDRGIVAFDGSWGGVKGAGRKGVRLK